LPKREVDDLIDATTGQWDTGIVQQTFVEQDANLILAMPVHTDMEDMIAWHYDTKKACSLLGMQTSCNENCRKSGVMMMPNHQ
jgi:hypothetical protein